ncbi:MAG: secretin N-terminal domain-containing protein [Elusimicrobiota bacterium]
MRKIVLFVSVCLVFQMLWISCPVSAAENLLSIDFEQVPLGSVLRVLTSKTGRKFITDSELSSKRIVLHLNNVTPDEAVNALLDTYNLYYVRQADTNIYVIKSKESGKITTVSRIFYCSYATARNLTKVLTSMVTSGGKIDADDRTNAIIVTDMADVVEKIGKLIAELDTPTPQVLLEARIIDIKITDSLDSGVNFSLFHNKNGASEDTIKYNQALAPNQSVTSKVTMGILDGDYDIDAIIEAIVTKTDAKVLTNPKLLVLNNRTATITIVDEVPYQELTQTSEGGSMVSTEFKEVGVLLKVQPLINKDGTIILNIQPEQSFDTGVSVSAIPIINTSKVNTTFMLRDGETAVIGGLIRETNTVTEYKVPLLGDIPILGYLFKRVDISKTRKELTVFVTAHIIQEYY